MQRTLIVGDVHGCHVELMALIDKAGLSDDDQIIAVGDIVDRGPETPQVLDFFAKNPHVRTVMGNHERKHVRGARGEIRLALSQIIAQRQFGDAYQGALNYMADLPLYIELPECIIFHGFLEPNVPLQEQRDVVLVGTMTGQRYLAENYPKPWYTYDAFEKPVVIGHFNYNNSDEPFIYKDRIFGIDTSCYHGGVLTGLVLPDFRVLSVPSREDHWYQIKRAYADVMTELGFSAPRAKKVTRENNKRTWQEELDVNSAQDLREKTRVQKQIDDQNRLGVYVQPLMKEIEMENASILSQMESEPDYQNLSDREKGKRYNKRIQDKFLGQLLHLARLNRLTEIDVKNWLLHFSEDDQVLRFLGTVDLDG